MSHTLNIHYDTHSKTKYDLATYEKDTNGT